MRCSISEFKEIEISFKDEPILIKTLKEIGYNPVVHEKGIKMENSYSKSKPTAHIVVPKGQFGGVYGDVGFERQADKSFKMYIDDTDERKFNIGQLRKTYGLNKLKKYVSSTAKYTISSQRETKKGQKEVKLIVR